MFQPRRSTRPRWKHGFLETLCKYPPRAISSLARKPPYRQAEANALSRKGQVSYVTHVAAVDPARRLPADGTKRLAGFGPGRHNHRFADARNALRNKPARDERETSKIASHGADSPRETAQTRHHTSSNLSQSRRLTSPRQRQSGACDADRRSDPAPNRNEGLVIIEPQKGASGENQTEESDDPLAISIACAVLRGFQASDSIHSHVRRFKLQARIFFCSRSSVSNRPPLGMACAIR